MPGSVVVGGGNVVLVVALDGVWSRLPKKAMDAEELEDGKREEFCLLSFFFFVYYFGTRALGSRCPVGF